MGRAPYSVGRVAHPGVSKYSIALGLLAAIPLCLVPNNAAAETRTWEPPGGNFFWHVGENWEPEGIPTTNDDVVIPSGFIQLNADTEPVNNFDLTGGIMFTLGFRLRVGNSGIGILTVTGTGTSNPVLNVVPRNVNGQALSAEAVFIGDAGLIHLNSLDPEEVLETGARSLQILPGGELRTSGAGLVALGFSGVEPSPLINDGLIKVQGATLFFSQGSPDEIDLDGINEDGIVEIASSSTLEIITPNLETVDSTITIGSGGSLAVLEIDMGNDDLKLLKLGSDH